MESKTVYIYGLWDPRTLELRYIGRARNPRDRFYRHIHEARRSTVTHKSAWIRGLLNEGLKPAIEILEECSEDNWQEVERAWIAEAKMQNANIVNATIGGEGLIGYVYSDEHRKKLSEARKGRVISEAHRLRLIESNRTRVYSEETRKKMSESNKGKPGNRKGSKWSEEAKEKMRKAKLGKKASEETRRKMRENNRGENNPMYGKTHSEEAREKIGQGQLGRKQTEDHKMKNSLGLKKAWEKRRLKK